MTTMWPGVEFEEHAWVGTPGPISRRVRERHSGPYRAAVVPGIGDLDFSLPVSVTSLATEAVVAVARFDSELGRDFASPLSWSEAMASSRIEGLTADARGIALVAIGEPAGENATAVWGNVRAVDAALRGRLDAEAVLGTHGALMILEPDIAGKWRDRQVWIGGTGHGPHEAVFVPPHHSHVPAAMDDLMAYANRTDVHGFVHAAIAHAQFETIHPFPDGNGRTGRALIHAILRADGIRSTVPVSMGLLAETDAYVTALTAYREGDPAPIVTAVSEAAFVGLACGGRLVDGLHEIRARWRDAVRARRESVVWRLMELLSSRPLLDVEAAAAFLGTTVANARRALYVLAEHGILTESTGKRRKRLWRAREVIDALNDVVTRAARRQSSRE